MACNYALPMAMVAILGGYLGARLALAIRPRYQKWLISAIGLGLAAYFFIREERPGEGPPHGSEFERGDTAVASRNASSDNPTTACRSS